MNHTFLHIRSRFFIFIKIRTSYERPEPFSTVSRKSRRPNNVRWAALKCVKISHKISETFPWYFHVFNAFEYYFESGIT